MGKRVTGVSKAPANKTNWSRRRNSMAERKGHSIHRHNRRVPSGDRKCRLLLGNPCGRLNLLRSCQIPERALLHRRSSVRPRQRSPAISTCPAPSAMLITLQPRAARPASEKGPTSENAHHPDSRPALHRPDVRQTNPQQFVHEVHKLVHHVRASSPR